MAGSASDEKLIEFAGSHRTVNPSSHPTSEKRLIRQRNLLKSTRKMSLAPFRDLYLTIACNEYGYTCKKVIVHDKL